MRLCHGLFMGGAGRNYSPKSLGASLAWYWDGDTPPVGTSWPDLSGNARSAVAPTSGKTPVVSGSLLNGHHYLTGDGVDDEMIASFASTQPQHVFMVCRFADIASNYTVIDGANLNTMRMYRGSSVNVVSMFAGSAVTASSGNSTSWRVYSMSFNGASAYLNDNGVRTLTGDIGTGGAAGGVTLWAAGSHVQFTPADIACCFGVFGVLSTGVESYNTAGLRRRYGI